MGWMGGGEIYALYKVVVYRRAESVKTITGDSTRFVRVPRVGGGSVVWLWGGGSHTPCVFAGPLKPGSRPPEETLNIICCSALPHNQRGRLKEFLRG